jgi:hypothetical protein
MNSSLNEPRPSVFRTRSDENVVRRSRSPSALLQPASDGDNDSSDDLFNDDTFYSSRVRSCNEFATRARRDYHMTRIRKSIGSKKVAALCCLALIVLFLNVILSPDVNVAKSVNTLDKGEAFVLERSNNGNKNATIYIPTLRPTKRPKSGHVKNSTRYEAKNSSYPDVSWFDDDATANLNSTKTLPPLVENASIIFQDRWCDLNGGVHWQHPKQDWQRRAPAFLIPGAKHSGTFELSQELLEHPLIEAPRNFESGFFFQNNFARYVSSKTDKTNVLAARERMYARDFPMSVVFQQEQSQKVSFDATPGYLFYSSTLPQRILCVMPWVKFVVLLRNPIDRIYDHYVVARQRGLKLTFDEWLEKEFVLLETVGLFNATTSKENNAWYEYRLGTLEGAMGRSLYEIQLRQWLQALRAVRSDAQKYMYVVRVEDIAANPQKEYSAILRFLGLPDSQLSNPRAWEQYGETSKPVVAAGISSATRKRLEFFFAKYNKRLKKLLIRYKVHTGGNI